MRSSFSVHYAASNVSHSHDLTWQLAVHQVHRGDVGFVVVFLTTSELLGKDVSLDCSGSDRVDANAVRGMVECGRLR
jgi:hypothetical protein